MKIYYYTMFSAVLMTLFYVAGVDTTSSFIFTRLGVLDIENFSYSTFFILIASLFTIGVVGSAIIGTFTNVSPQYILKSTVIMPVLLLLIADLISVLYFVDGWARWLLFLIIIPFVAGYAIALIEFWEARD